MRDGPRSTGVVLAGAAALGAYEVGVLSHLVDDVARDIDVAIPEILSGTSAGARARPQPYVQRLVRRCAALYSGRMASVLSSAVPPFPTARFSVEQYHRMIRSGAFTEDDRLELIEGWVVQQMAKGPGHEYAVGQGEELLRARVPAGWHVRNQAPITLTSSEPEPDLTIVRGDRGLYRHRHPAPADVALVVEVSDTSLDTDRVKCKTYAAAGIAEYWIINLVDRCIEVYTRPDATSELGYAGRSVFRANETVTLRIAGQALDSLAVSAVLP